METVVLALVCVVLVLLILATLTFIIPEWVGIWDRYRAMRARREESQRGDGA